MLQSAVDVAKPYAPVCRGRGQDHRDLGPVPAHRPPSPTSPPLLDGPSPSPSPAAAAPHLRTRPCRARKRGRASLASLPCKRPRPHLPTPLHPGSPGPKPLSPASPAPESPSKPPATDNGTSSRSPSRPRSSCRSPSGQWAQHHFRAHHPRHRPHPASIPSKRQPEVVEEEVESEALPAVVSDSHNRVRLANSAYNEMVGQPECVARLDGLWWQPRARDAAGIEEDQRRDDAPLAGAVHAADVQGVLVQGEDGVDMQRYKDHHQCAL